MNPLTKYLGVALGVFVAIAVLLLLSEFKIGARLAQFALVIVILVVALKHESQLVQFFQTIERK